MKESSLASYCWWRTILAKEDAVSDAPPTSAPSISGQRIISSTCNICMNGSCM